MCKLRGKNLANSVAIYGRGRELFIPPTYRTIILPVVLYVCGTCLFLYVCGTCLFVLKEGRRLRCLTVGC